MLLPLIIYQVLHMITPAIQKKNTEIRIGQIHILTYVFTLFLGRTGAPRRWVEKMGLGGRR